MVQKSDGPPESPTTARELDFDDEPQDTPGSPPSRKSGPGVASIPAQGSGEDVPPPKPPRPVSQEQQAENTLKEAFPSIDAAVVKAVLRASGGKVEPAFNALLGGSRPWHKVPSVKAHDIQACQIQILKQSPPPHRNHQDIRRCP